MSVFLQVLENIVLLTFLGLGFYAIENARPKLATRCAAVLHGLSFGAIAFLVTATPVTMADGATVDARAGPVVLAGVVAGPVAASIAAVAGGLARGFVGGNFAFSGVIVYFLYGAIGTGFWLYLRKNSLHFLTLGVISGLVLTSCIAAACMFFLIDPQGRAVAWLQNSLPYILTANTLSVVYTSMVLGIALSIQAQSREVSEVNERLRLAQRASGFGIWDFDIVTGKLNWDRKSREMHGVPDTEFNGTYEDWMRNVHPDDLPRAQEAFSKAIETADSFDAEYRVMRPDGTQKTIRGDAVLLRDDRGQAVRVVGTNLDLTSIRATEEQLQEAQFVAVQAQKFDTIGQLTGGVAHDFNNLLAVIMGNLELISDEIHAEKIDKKEIDSLLDASLEAARRGADLTRNMLAYARRARLTPVRLDLNEVVRETESWMRRTIASAIEIETNLQAGLWPTMADKSSLQSALVNLLVNARDALDGSGRITIETGNIRVDHEYIAERHEDIKPGRYVMLAVSDNGSGIEQDMLGRIFDPFFTTKRVGEGSGLGLSMVQGFVKQSGGAIRVYSEPGVGTSFKMYFPALVTDLADQKIPEPREVATPSPENAGKRILLVEDRKEVLLVMQKTLEGAGFHVTTATSGDEGYDLFARCGNFDLVVTDIVMPGTLQGPMMAREIRALKPDVRFVFLSGYASEATVHGNGVLAEDIRLMKPVSRSALISAVQTCLEAAEDADG